MLEKIQIHAREGCKNVTPHLLRRNDGFHNWKLFSFFRMLTCNPFVIVCKFGGQVALSTDQVEQVGINARGVSAFSYIK